ncbi:hypothetical protein WA1_08225 [Scytonema hofmannii PCC 7110]|uniref:Uncharacterized protein n=1 Tax=Scytonema hofmannii PCC 7110 TaxID=128403 RepID=A0A139WRT7_9CYAN|nr:hypothetical protein [Scytonema hofmannii]KYC35143.1 hypothetical protein WA1_08225 [Scytonema hofmannii PCC 7110]
MRNFSELLQDIKDNPVRYLDQPSITCLHSFLVGYLSTLSDLGFIQEGFAMNGFQEWVQERANTTVTQSWAGILLFTCGSERLAFDSFFKDFEKFASQKGRLESERNFESNVDNIKPRRNYDIYELLGWIKKRPGMYLGTSSITRLEMILRGYTLARREVGLAPTEQEREFEGFQPWLQQRYGIKSNQSWAKIILFNSMDEREALERFFELFEEYLNRNKSSNQVSEI